MSEMKEMVLDVVERIFKDQVSKETVDLVEDGKWAEDLWSILQENEMLTVAISETAGGAGGDLDDLFNIFRLIGKYAVPIPFVEFTVANYLLELANLPITMQKVTYAIDQDELLIMDSQNTITGTLTNVPWARHVEELVTLVKCEKGVRIVKLSLGDAKIETSINLAGEPRDTVTFNLIKAEQISESLLTNAELQYIMKIETAAKVALMAGAIDKAVELSIQYSKEREQFGRPIHRFQLVQQHIATLVGESVLVKSSLDNMIAALTENREVNEVAFARIRVNEAARTVTTSAHQVHGAIGVTHEHSLHQYSRRLWSWREEGAEESAWSKYIVDDLLNSDQDSLWSYLTSKPLVRQTN